VASPTQVKGRALNHNRARSASRWGPLVSGGQSRSDMPQTLELADDSRF